MSATRKKAKTSSAASITTVTRGGGRKKKKQEENLPELHFVSDEFIPEWMNKERTKVITEPDNFTTTAAADTDTDATTDDDSNHHRCVYYWMQRDMRTFDNWALLFAQHLAQMQNIPLRVLYVLPCPYTDTTDATDTTTASSTIKTTTTTTTATKNNKNDLPPKVYEMQMTKRHASFLLGGLKLIEKELMEKNVPFHVLMSKSHSEVGQTVHDFVVNGNGKGDMYKDNNNNKDCHHHHQVASFVVCDMNPLRQYRNWVEDQAMPLMKKSNIPFYQVDAHNVVPVWFASPKREVGARTLRPKINKLLPEFLTHFPDFDGNDHIQEPITNSSLMMTTTTAKTANKEFNEINWDECQSYLNWDDSVPIVSWAKPGRTAAMERFAEFSSSKTQGLKNFDSLRNDPNYKNVCSNLSPWVNYGMVSFQRLALEVRKLKKYPNGTASYIEEGIVRRELSDNFVYYSRDNYDDLTCAAGWAQETLAVHSEDEREYLYSLEELEKSQTHDDLWNAAQIQLVTEGTMHGFLRMYWAKKILEWTKSPEVALRTGLYFNDRFALDGNDPNGFTGVGWSIFGLHDMGWKERPIFGKIRFMNYNGCKRKFKVDMFVAKYNKAKLNAMKTEAKQGKVEIKPMKKRKAASR